MEAPWGGGGDLAFDLQSSELVLEDLNALLPPGSFVPTSLPGDDGGADNEDNTEAAQGSSYTPDLAALLAQTQDPAPAGAEQGGVGIADQIQELPCEPTEPPTPVAHPNSAPAFASPDAPVARNRVLGVHHHSPDDDQRNVRARTAAAVMHTSREVVQDRKEEPAVRDILPPTAAEFDGGVYVVSLHEVEDKWAYRPRPCQRTLMHLELKANASFKDLDEFMRVVFAKGDNMSKFTVYRQGQDELGRPFQDDVNGGFGESDQFAPEIDDLDQNPRAAKALFGAKSTTKISALLRVGQNFLWTHHPTASSMIMYLKVLKLNPASELPSDDNPVCEVRAFGAAEYDPAPVVPPGVLSFDQAFPCLATVAANPDPTSAGCFEVGKNLSPFWGFAWTYNGNIGELDTPGVNLDLSLHALEDAVRKSKKILVSPNEGAPAPAMGAPGLVFSFHKAFPKVSKFISTNSRKRWIEVGYGRPGSYIRAKKGARATVVWESTFRKDYGGSIHSALMDLEQHLP
jgi:hypothetical protein